MTSPAPVAVPRIVLADTVPGARVRDVLLALGGAAFVGLAAQIAIPLAGNPVPVTGQTFAMLLVGAALGWQRAVPAMGLYALAGLAGVPWFAGGTSGYPAATFGYIVSYILVVAVVGSLAARGADRTPLRTATLMLLGSALIYAIGVPWLAAATSLDLAGAVSKGMVPFLLGDGLKVLLAAGLLPAAWKLVGSQD